jgi:hypothetical protein
MDSLNPYKWGFYLKRYSDQSSGVWGPKGQSFHVRVKAQGVSSRARWDAVGFWGATSFTVNPRPSLRSSRGGQVSVLPPFDTGVIDNASLTNNPNPMISVRMGNPNYIPDVENPHNLKNVLFVCFMDAHSENERCTGGMTRDCIDMLNQGPLIVVWGTNEDRAGFFFARSGNIAPPFNTSGDTLGIVEEAAALHEKYVIGLITLALEINPNPILNHNPNPNPYPNRVAKLH